jgi:DHA3 family macrolide efflux protein-like MFS transporter
MLQEVIHPEVQGRVFTLISSSVQAMTPIGLLFAGPLADFVAVQFWYIVAGAACVVLGLVALGIPALMRIQEGHPNYGKDEELVDDVMVKPVFAD